MYSTCFPVLSFFLTSKCELKESLLCNPLEGNYYSSGQVCGHSREREEINHVSGCQMCQPLTIICCGIVSLGIKEKQKAFVLVIQSLTNPDSLSEGDSKQAMCNQMFWLNIDISLIVINPIWLTFFFLDRTFYSHAVILPKRVTCYFQLPPLFGCSKGCKLRHIVM